MRMHELISIRVAAALAASAAILFLAATAGADGEPVEIPEGFRGIWMLRLTSDDGGKTYRAADGKPICEVSKREIKFTRKVEFSVEKLVVKSVTKSDGKGTATHLIGFDNGKVWKLSENGGSITAIIHDREKEKLTEKYRIRNQDSITSQTG